MVYDNLRRLAHHQLRQERPGHTLQTSALVHEVYLNLVRDKDLDIRDRAHFFAICAHLMREILVQYARRKKAAKRNGGHRLPLEDMFAVAQSRSIDLVALDDALNHLSKLDEQQSRIVELRFFSGLSIEETALVLGLSPATVKRHWSTARIWLHDQIRRTGS
jgi:RNA polymerase sigma factor (TIGR02999 family)